MNSRRPIALLLGLVFAYLVFHFTASALGSDRGQAGVVVGAIVVAAVIAVERMVFAQPTRDAARSIGLGRASRRGIIVALGLSVALLLVIPAFAVSTGERVSMYPGWGVLIAGLFAQAGIAEEVLFRGYLFRHVREGRDFWPAALIAMLPFVAVHLVIFASQAWPIALAAVGLSAVMSFPLAHLFELGGNTIWPPAILHFVAQGAIKVVEVEGGGGMPLPVIWMIACAVVPFLAFLVATPSRGGPRADAA